MILALSAPTSILVKLVFFVMSYLIALALMMFAVSDLGVMDSLYQSGSTLMTLGVVEQTNSAQVVITIIAAFAGLVVISILIGYLLSLYSAYTERETQVAKLSLLAGEPAWGPEIVCRSSLLADGRPHDDIESWIDWCSHVRMSQTVSPVLDHYRSASPRRSWVITMLAILDSAALHVTTVRGRASVSDNVRLLAAGTQALAVLRGHETYRSGTMPEHAPATKGTRRASRATDDAGRNAVVHAIATDARRSWPDAPESVGVALDSSDPGITREEWDHACDVMRQAGVELVDDLEKAWTGFSALRSTYFANAHVLAQAIYVVQAPWSGERQPETETIWPALAADGIDLPL